MPSLDTNVIVRLLVRDDERQASAARRLIRGCLERADVLFVPITVALELEWVLRSSYGLPKTEVVQMLSDLLSTTELAFEAESAFELALRAYIDGKADFSDCMHAALASQAGHAPLLTFDKAAAKNVGAALLV